MRTLKLSKTILRSAYVNRQTLISGKSKQKYDNRKTAKTRDTVYN